MTDTTTRGFAIQRLWDSGGKPFTIQESSVATDEMIWLGAEDGRLHLNRDDAHYLACELMHFANTGEIAVAAKTAPVSKQPIVEVAEYDADNFSYLSERHRETRA